MGRAAHGPAAGNDEPVEPRSVGAGDHMVSVIGRQIAARIQIAAQDSWLCQPVSLDPAGSAAIEAAVDGHPALELERRGQHTGSARFVSPDGNPNLIAAGGLAQRSLQAGAGISPGGATIQGRTIIIHIPDSAGFISAQVQSMDQPRAAIEVIGCFFGDIPIAIQVGLVGWQPSQVAQADDGRTRLQMRIVIGGAIDVIRAVGIHKQRVAGDDVGSPKIILDVVVDDDLSAGAWIFKVADLMGAEDAGGGSVAPQNTVIEIYVAAVGDIDTSAAVDACRVANEGGISERRVATGNLSAAAIVALGMVAAKKNIHEIRMTAIVFKDAATGVPRRVAAEYP